MAKKIRIIPEETRYLFPNFELKDKKTRIIYGIWGVMAVTGAVLTSIPFVWMVVTSMIPAEKTLAALPDVISAFRPDLSYFKRAWEIAPFARYFLNSLLVAGAVVLGQVIISAMAAYSLSKLRPALHKVLLVLFLSTVMIPFETIAIPLYLFMRDFSLPGVFSFNLVNTYWALILPGLANAFNIFIFKSFFDKMPNDFIEAARVDGYGEMGIFFRIVLPISKPIMTVLAILNFVNIWNSFFWPLIVTNEPSVYTLMIGIYRIIEEGQPWNIVMAGVTISMIPTILLFAFFQRQVMRGVIFTTLQE
ncbi:MAG TPA: carbohydrate ABC transporter permease [Candidatus Goldiibacteriota bacterium]|nr:carbohydrate ABC transporter permease [Candidatus Goldiibacteriota bacterium]